MIVAPGVTAADRRKAIRALANVSDITETDDLLDARVAQWDEVARAYFGAPDGDISDKPYLRNLITFSNLETAASILNSLGGNDNINAAKEHRAAAKAIVAAEHNKAEEQGDQFISTTAGISGQQRGDFD